jgi:phage terminase large subunit GpA-like protein
MAVHGVPRGTQALGVWIDPGEENAERVWLRGRLRRAGRARVRGTPGAVHRPRGPGPKKRKSGRRKDLTDVEALGELPPPL